MNNKQVFISYAHADDQPFAAEPVGWVSQFVDQLQTAISMKSGGSQVSCWMDHSLEPQRAVDDTLRKRIRDSQCILAFMSPRYLESEWCRKEMTAFVELVGGGEANDRVFLVELLPTERNKWHPGIRSISEIKFWSKSLAEPEPMILGWPVPDTKADKPYWRELNNLASILARQMLGISPPQPSIPPALKTNEPASSSPAAKIVWIADPNDDVLDQWESLAAALREKGHEVLPEVVGQYPYQEEALYRQALNTDLARVDLLVQLLGSLPGRKPAWAEARFVQIQADVAKTEAQRRNLSMLLWRSPDIALEAIKDPLYKALLASAKDSEFESFCRLIIDSLSLPPTPSFQSLSCAQLSVVVNADKPDRDLGKKVQDILVDDLDVDATLAAEPLPTQKPEEYFNHMHNLLAVSQGVLIVYGAAPPSWVQAQKAEAAKVLSGSHKGIWGAVLDGPPEQKLDHGIKSRSLMVLDCRNGLIRDPLKRFVEMLREANHV